MFIEYKSSQITNHALVPQLTFIEHEPCPSISNHTLNSQSISMKNESYSQDIQFITQISNIDSISIFKSAKKVHINDFYIKVLYHKSIFKISNYKKYSILISIIKYIKINDLISLILIQSLSFIAVNIFNSDFIKFIISKIFDYYQNLFEIFFK